MNKCLALLAIFVSLYSSAYTVNLIVIEGVKSTPCKSCEVKVEKYNGKLVTSAVTNDKGLARLTLKSKKVRIVVSESSGNYEENMGYPIGINGEELMIIIYPTAKYDTEIWAAEDSIYGKVNMNYSSLEADTLELDTKATFKGGNNQMQEYISETIIYPEFCLELGISGEVIVSFVIEKTGEISHVSIDKSVSKRLDREAIRIIRAMPNWTPGMIIETPVRTRCFLPIKYILE